MRVRPLMVIVLAAASTLLLACAPMVVGDDTQPSEPSQYVSAATSGGALRGGLFRVLQDDEALHGAASIFRTEVYSLIAQGDDQDGDLLKDGEGTNHEEEMDHHEDIMDESRDHSGVHTEAGDFHSDAHDDTSDAIELPEGHSESDGHDHSFSMAQTQSSASGYDVDSGTSPICWISEGTTSSSRGLNDTERYPYIWHSNFAPDFFAGPTNMLESCFEGFELEVEAPRPDEREDGDKLYTQKQYIYRIHGKLDVSGIREAIGQQYNVYGEAHESSTGHMVFRPRVSVELVFCRIRTMGGGLCSPFVYQHDIHGDAHVQDNDGDAHESHHSAFGEESDHVDSHDSSEDSHHDHKRLQEESHDDQAETVEAKEDHGHESHDQGAGHEDDHEYLTIDSVEDRDIAHESHDHDEEVGHGVEDHAFLTSGVVMIDVDPDDAVVDIDVHVPFTMRDPESIFAIAVVRTLLSDSEGKLADNANDPAFAYKFDASNIIHERMIVYEDAPVVNSVSQGTIIFSFILIGVVGAIIATLLVLVVYYRKHKVFKLSQGTFLIVFLGSAVVASASAFLFNPKNTVYCNLHGPLMMIPLQFMVAVVTGRLWRIQSLMQPLMGWANKNHKVLSRKEALKAARRWLPNYKTSSSASGEDTSPQTSSPAANRSSVGRILQKFSLVRQPSNSLRRKVSAKHMSLVIVLITLPQVLVQVVLLSISPYVHVIDWNDEMTVGRYDCANRVSAFNWLGYAIFCVAVVILLVVAFRSRNLPSLFNEAGSMFSSVLASLAVAAVGVALIFATNTPTSNPDVGYLLSVAIVLCFTLQMSVRIIMPKLKLVWSGEAIVVAKVFQEHASKKIERSDLLHRTAMGASLSRLVAPVVLADSLKSSRRKKEPQDRINHASMNGTDEAESGSRNEQKHVHLPDTSSITLNTECNNNEQDGLFFIENGENTGAETRRDFGLSSRKDDAVVEVPRSKRVNFDPRVVRESTGDSVMEIRDDEPPPQEMIMNLLRVSQLISRSSQRMLSGLQVSREEWEELQDAFIKMGHTFEENVAFAWQEGGKDEHLDIKLT